MHKAHAHICMTCMNESAADMLKILLTHSLSHIITAHTDAHMCHLELVKTGGVLFQQISCLTVHNTNIWASITMIRKFLNAKFVNVVAIINVSAHAFQTRLCPHQILHTCTWLHFCTMHSHTHTESKLCFLKRSTDQDLASVIVFLQSLVFGFRGSRPIRTRRSERLPPPSSTPWRHWLWFALIWSLLREKNFRAH